jgi:hypothetical protein
MYRAAAMNDRLGKASGSQVAGSSDNEQRRSILLDMLSRTNYQTAHI